MGREKSEKRRQIELEPWNKNGQAGNGQAGNGQAGNGQAGPKGPGKFIISLNNLTGTRPRVRRRVVWDCLRVSSVSSYTPRRSLRSSSDKPLSVPRVNLKTAGARSFQYQPLCVWNSVPIQTRFSTSLSIIF